MITTELLNSITTTIGDNIPDLALKEKLKSNFPDILIKLEDDDNISGIDPVYSGNTYNLYFIDTGNHCHTLTRNSEAATGILIGIIES
jgi:hypothetical protein